MLNEGESAEKVGGEDGEDGTDDPEWDEKEEGLAGGDPPRADTDFGKAGHLLGDASRPGFLDRRNCQRCGLIHRRKCASFQ